MQHVLSQTAVRGAAAALLPGPLPRSGLPRSGRRRRARRGWGTRRAGTGGGKPIPGGASDGSALQPDAAGVDEQQHLTGCRRVP